jgi:hypothetical protein
MMLSRLNKLPLWVYFLITLSIIAIAGFIEYSMGHVVICKCGTVKLWQGVVNSSENSQHISDWYSFSHIIHGMVFFYFFRLISKKRFSIGLCLLLAIFVEASWEVFENSNFIINRYREATISLDYFGDSILNSVCDMLFAVIGFFLAAYLPVWLIIFLIIFMEIWVGYMIRDNLTLNIIMLIYPFESIKHWQMGGLIGG